MNDLSLDYINTKSPYLVKRADDGDYVFQTDAAIIVENRNPLAKAIVDDFELTAQMLTEDK